MTVVAGVEFDQNWQATVFVHNCVWEVQDLLAQHQFSVRL